MNKLACKEKVTNAKALGEFRNENDIKKIARYESRPTGKQTFRDIKTADVVFGRPNRATTPIKGIITGEFGN